ncbi:MAG: transcriptional regulator [Proteobacteria bacterium]|nr:MAG: transcriptional regulator [Pseudomonadota bacterium]
MYTPKSFVIDDRGEVLSFLKANAFGQLISNNQGKLVSTHLPFLFNESGTKAFCHLAKQNPQLNDLEGQDVMLTFEGEHGYISPSWYQKEGGVPTWNYQVAHVYGITKIITDDNMLTQILHKLTGIYEKHESNPWQPNYNQALNHTIIGVEIDIKDIQCKYKLSQNRSEEDQKSVINALEARGEIKLAQAMKKFSLKLT